MNYYKTEFISLEPTQSTAMVEHEGSLEEAEQYWKDQLETTYGDSGYQLISFTPMDEDEVADIINANPVQTPTLQ